MKKNLLLAACLCCLCLTATQRVRAQYVPTPENLEARKQFEGFRFGIFLHWGIYSEFAQGEWYLNTGQLNKDEYAKAASCFYPVRFNAQEWVKAIRESGARYITFTSRHHDGFSMFHTAQNRYNNAVAAAKQREEARKNAKMHVSETDMDKLPEGVTEQELINYYNTGKMSEDDVRNRYTSEGIKQIQENGSPINFDINKKMGNGIPCVMNCCNKTDRNGKDIEINRINSKIKHTK